MRGSIVLSLYLCAAAAGAYTPGSSDGRMGGAQNNRSGLCDSGPQSFPLTTQRVWSVGAVGQPVVSGDRVYTAGTAVRCYDLLTGNYLWGYSPDANGGGTIYTRSLAVDDQRVYFSTKNTAGGPPGAVFAVDARTGSFQWVFTNRASGYSCTAPLVRDGRVYFSGKYDKLRAVSAATGEIIWETAGVVSSTDYGGMAMDGDRLFIFTGDRYLRCYSASNGASLWDAYNSERPSWAESWPVVSSGLVYLANNETTYGLYVYWTTNGSLIRLHTNYRYTKYMSPAVSDGKYYVVGAPQSDLYRVSLMAFDALGGGAPLWSVLLATQHYGNVDSPILANGVLYCQTTNLVAVDAASGTVLWQTTGQSSGASPFARHGRLFLAANSGLSEFSDGSDWPTANQAPVIQLPGPHIVPVGVSTSFSVTASDADGDAILLTNTVAPALASFAAGVFSWTAPSTLAGTTQQLVFCANDQVGVTNSVVTNLTQLVVPFDSDSDEMGDGWEWDYFQTLSVMPGADADGDGADNLSECIAGTHPSNLNSRFTFATHGATGAAYRIRVDAVNGRQYTVRFSDVLPTQAANWRVFANQANGIGRWTETNPAGSTFYFLDDQTAGTSGGPATNGARYYRVGVRKP